MTSDVVAGRGSLQQGAAQDFAKPGEAGQKLAAGGGCLLIMFEGYPWLSRPTLDKVDGPLRH